MRHNSLGIIFIVLATLLFSGCRTAPVYNVSDAPFTAAPQSTNQQDIARAIVTAGRSLGWIMKEEGQGHILGTLHLRSHTAIVDIFYDNSTYSINYKNSTNLKYDGSKIHSNYNGWIENLANAINVQVSNL